MLPLQEPANQEPRPGLPSRAGVGPVSFTGPQAVAYQRATLADRREQKRSQAWAKATTEFRESVLPAMAPDPLDQEVALEGFFALRDGGDALAAWEASVGSFGEESKERMGNVMRSYERHLEAALANPLSASDSNQESMERYYRIAEHPQGMEIMGYYADKFGSDSDREKVHSIQQMRDRFYYAANQLSAPTDQSFIEESRGLRRVGAEGAINWADRLDRAHNQKRHYFPGGLPEERKQDIDAVKHGEREDFTNYAYVWSQALARDAATFGIDYAALEEVPSTIKEGREAFERALDVLAEVESEQDRRDAARLRLWGKQGSTTTLIEVARGLHAYQENLPEGEDPAATREMLDLTAALAGGDITMKSQIEGSVPLVATVFHYMMAPDVLLGEMTTGAIPKVRPTELVFDDGYVAYDALTAAEHTLDLLADGGVLEANPHSVMESDAGREDAMHENLQEAGGLSGFRLDKLPETVDTLSALAPLLTWGVSQTYMDITGGYDDPERGTVYALPVGLYERTTEWDSWADRASEFGAYLGGDAGDFIMDEMYAAPLGGRQHTNWGQKAVGFMFSMAVDTVASPYNLLNTGMVRQGAVAVAEKEVAEVVAKKHAAKIGPPVKKEAMNAAAGVDEVVGAVAQNTKSKQTRLIRFKDGAEMSPEWVALHDSIAKVFRVGGPGDTGGAEEIAEMVVSRLRDSPADAMQAFMAGLKEDSKFLDQFADLLGSSGVWLDEAPFMREGVTLHEARRQAARKVWQDSENLVGDLVEGATEKFGKGDFWANGQRQRIMENSRGLYLGDLGIPLTPVTRKLESVHNKWREFAKSKEGSKLVGAALWVDKSFEKVGAVAPGLFSASHWATREHASKAGVLPAYIKVPYRLRAMYAEKYRRVMANGTQRVQRTVIDAVSLGFTEKGEWLGTLKPKERNLLTLLVASGDDAREAAERVWAHRELWRGQGVELPMTQSALQRRFEGMSTQAEKVRELNELAYSSELSLGLQVHARQDKYVTHYFKGVDAAKLQKELGRIRMAEEIASARGVEAPGKVNAGVNAKKRIGPIDIYEAAQKGFDPELDMAMLLSARLSQHLDVVTKGSFARSIAAEYGVPAVRGREALARVLQNGKVGRWEAEGKVWKHLDDIDEHNAEVGKLRKGLKSSRYLAHRRGWRSLTKTLGIRMADVFDGKSFVGKALRSDDFLRLAASRRKGVLDKILPTSLRDAWRKEAREALALRGQVAEAQADVARHGYGPQGMERISLDDAAHAANLAHQTADMSLSIIALKKQLKGAEEARNYVSREVNGVRIEVESADEVKGALLRKRGEISSSWDEAKESLAGLGYDVESLSAAKSLDSVRMVPEVIPAATTHRAAPSELFDAYKKHQGEYRENFAALKAADNDIAYWRNQLGLSEKRLAVAERELRGARGRVNKAGKEKGSRKAGQRKHGKENLKSTDRAEAAAQKLREASARLKELEARMAFLADTPAMRETVRHMQKSVSRLARMHRGIRQRAAALNFSRGISYSVARHRALAPRGFGAIRAATEKRVRQTDRFYKDKKKFDSYRQTPVHIPEGDVERFVRVEETFRAFGWGNDDVSRILWDNFGASHLAEVPIAELESLVSANGGLWGKMGRFTYDPADGLVSSLRVADYDTAAKVAKEFGIDAAQMNREKLGEKLQEALDDLFARVADGDEVAIAKARELDPKEVSRLFVPEDVSAAFARAEREGVSSRGKHARMVDSQGVSPLQKELANTYVPMEIGMLHRQMVGEGLVSKEALEVQAKASKFTDRMAWAAATERLLRLPNTAFKLGALHGKPSRATNTRNGLLDGFKSILHHGMYMFFNHKVFREFWNDMHIKEGLMDTAAGPRSRASLHATKDTQGGAIYSARMDNMRELGLSMTPAQEASRRKAFQSTLEQQGREMTRKKGAGVSRGGAAGAALGVVPGHLAGDALAGAELGFTAGVVAEGVTKGTPHSAGRMPTLAEAILGTTPAAGEALENLYRNFIAWSYIKSGMGPREAYSRMNVTMRDYTNVKPIDRLIASAPIMFWNFTKQNAIAMGARFAESPARLTFLPRLAAKISEGAGEEYKDEWQTFANTVFIDNTGYYISDELEAAIALGDPIWQLLVNRNPGAAAGFLTSSASPIIKELVDEWGDSSLPQALAANIYAKHGSVDIPGLQIWQDKNGIIQSSMSKWLRLGVVFGGLHVGLREIGRQREAAKMGHWGRVAVEAFGLTRLYSAETALDQDLELQEALLKKYYQSSDLIQYEEDTRSPYSSMPDGTSESREIVNSIIKHMEGPRVRGEWSIIRDFLRDRSTGSKRKEDAGTSSPK